MKNKSRHIPNEWKQVRLEEVCLARLSYGANAPSVDYDDTLPRYLRITDISEDGKLLQNDFKSISIKEAENYYLKKGDIVFARTGATVGKTYIHKSDDLLAYAGYLIRCRPDPKKIFPSFLFFYTQSNRYKIWIINTLRTGAQPNINSKEYARLRVPLPPLSEQRAIASILTVADRLISLQERLIEAKRKQKLWLMQKLLTGKMRLKGFTKEWKEAKLGELGKIVAGNTPSKQNLENWGGEFCWVTAEDMKGKYVSKTSIKLTALGKSKTRWLPAETVLITCIASIGLNAIAKIECATNQQINAIIVSKKFSNEFIYYVLSYYKKTLIKAAGIGGIQILNKSVFSNIKIPLPPLSEQRAIAAILTIADEEISLLKRKLDLLIQQKRGLMQKLLTGKWSTANVKVIEEFI
ncbi:MAG: restriction endonuclease subunit S [Holosporaceae bacterium]|jgi:type I restriction enzyme S subunit|nr:restriction endonuclease subunit S [Holosporaceae bacterium]